MASFKSVLATAANIRSAQQAELRAANGITKKNDGTAVGNRANVS
jgi:hypothetical protein